MNKYAVFSPIKQPELVYDYYLENNLEIPDNDYFNNMFVKPYWEQQEKRKDITSPITDTNSKVFKLTKNVANLPAWRQKYAITDPNSVFKIGDAYDPVADAIGKLDNVTENEREVLHKNPIANEIRNLKISDEDKKYLTWLGFYEGSFKPNQTPTKTYKGMFQFGSDALKDIGMTVDELLKDTTNQYIAALRYADINAKRLKPIIEIYNGAIKDGVKITESGIKAAAHLLGAGAVKDWFYGTTNTEIAKNGFVDGNGTHITKYLQRFSE